MNDTSKLTEQTSDQTQWRYPSLWSANRTNHIANLEKEVATLQFKLSEITTQLAQSREDAHLLRVQCNVGDKAFQHLFEQNKATEAELAKFHAAMERERIKALEAELSLANDCVSGLERNLKALEGELAQDHAALKLALDGFLTVQNKVLFLEGVDAAERAITAIKACGVTQHGKGAA